MRKHKFKRGIKMQIEKISNNNTTFGIKLVLREDMFPHKAWNQPNVKELKRLITTVEKRTADNEGTMYVPGVWRDWDASKYTEHMNIYFNNGSYNDGVTLYDINKTDLRHNTDKFIDTLVKLTDVFKLRESAVRTTQLLREHIEELQSELNGTFDELGKKVNKTFAYQKEKVFANDVLDGRKGLEPNGKNFKDLSLYLAEDEKIQNETLAKIIEL